MKPKLIKPVKINEILDNCLVYTKSKYECATRCRDNHSLSYPLWSDYLRSYSVLCEDIKDCNNCFLQQRNVLNIIKYIKKNKLHTELCYTKKTTKR